MYSTSGGGHGVQAHRRASGTASTPDPEALTLARAERRAVIISNVRDFRPLHAETVTPGGPGHYGMIFMSGKYRRAKDDTGKIIAALEDKLAQYPGDDALANAKDWL